MPYHVKRGSQLYGPYSLADLQQYVASGNVLSTDLARTDEMPNWVPVSQLLGSPTPPAPAPLATFSSGVPKYPQTTVQTAGYYPDPPNLHWALVLLIGVFCGLFTIVWEVVQASWMRKVNPRSKALMLYIFAWLALFGGCILLAASQSSGDASSAVAVVGLIGCLTFFVLAILARFDMRRSIEEHFNGPEPIGLSLSGAMTFFFGLYYFQYHFTRINDMKRVARYRGSAL